MMTGTATILMMLFVGGNVIRQIRLGRRRAHYAGRSVHHGNRLLLPSVMFRDALSGFIAMMGTTPLMLAVVFGTAQNFFSKSAKYSLFDPTKEMAYIPLDQESKVKGKAAIDVVGARLGKAGGAVIQQVLIVSLGSLAAITPYIAAILFGIIAAWILAGAQSEQAPHRAFCSERAEKLAEEAAPAAPVKARATAQASR